MRIEKDKEFGGLILRDLGMNNGNSVVISAEEAEAVYRTVQHQHDMAAVRECLEFIIKHPEMTYQIMRETALDLLQNEGLLDEYTNRVRAEIDGHGVNYYSACIDAWCVWQEEKKYNEKHGMENKDTILYLHDGNYARNNFELDMYRKSYEANIACNELIARTLNEHFDGLHLDAKTVMDDLLKVYSIERIQYVLANTIQHKDWDGRFSHENKAWAKSIEVVPLPDPCGNDRTCYFVVDKAHSCLVDGLVTFFRKEVLEQN